MAEGEAPGKLDDLLRQLRRARKANDDGLKEVASKLDVSFQAVQRWETGADRPTPARMRRWLRAVDLPEDWALLYDEFLAEEDIEKILDRLRPPLSPEQRAAARVDLRNRLRTRRA